MASPVPRSDLAPPLDPCMRDYLASETIAREYDECFKDANLFSFDTQVLDRWLPQPASMVDLGCGTGRHLLHFARRHFSVTGVDLSDHMLEICRDKIQRESLMARLVKADLRALSGFQDESFVYAICMFSTLGMLRGRDNRMQTLREVWRLLRPGGLLALHVHNSLYMMFNLMGAWRAFQSWSAIVRGGLEFGDRIFEDYRGVKNMYLHTFTAVELLATMRDAGFEVQELFPLNAERSGRQPGPFATLRANGFLLLARKPS